MNEGINVIVGKNHSGKTLLFNLIMYIMGLKKEINCSNDILDKLYFKELAIDFFAGSGEYRIQRQINSKEILFSGKTNCRVQIGSSKYYEIYSEILGQKFSFGDDKLSINEILRASFISEIKTLRAYNNIDTVKKILGINTRYLKKSKEQIKTLEQEVKNNEISYEILTKYMFNISGKLKKMEDMDAKSIQTIENVLKEEYMNLCSENLEDEKFIQESLNAYERLKLSSERLFNEKIEKIECKFEKICSKLGIVIDYKFIDVLNKNIRREFLSSGQNKLLEVIITLILVTQDDFEFDNSTGLLVIDNLFSYDLDFEKINGVRRVLAEECGNRKLQCIEFTNERDSIPKEWIILDLDKGGGFSWL